MSKSLEALEMRYAAEMASALANIDVYERNPAGIGEHPDIVEAVETQVRRYNEAKELHTTVLELLGKD